MTIDALHQQPYLYCMTYYSDSHFQKLPSLTKSKIIILVPHAQFHAGLWNDINAFIHYFSLEKNDFSLKKKWFLFNEKSSTFFFKEK